MDSATLKPVPEGGFARAQDFSRAIPRGHGRRLGRAELYEQARFLGLSEIDVPRLDMAKPRIFPVSARARPPSRDFAGEARDDFIDQRLVIRQYLSLDDAVVVKRVISNQEPRSRLSRARIFITENIQGPNVILREPPKSFLGCRNGIAARDAVQAAIAFEIFVELALKRTVRIKRATSYSSLADMTLKR